MPAPLHRLLYRLADWARRQVWKIRRPSVEGVRVLACDDQGRVLLVRHSYRSGVWLPPGGGLGSGESPLAAARRELAEETGIVLEQARLVAVSTEDLHGASNRVHIVIGAARGTLKVDGREIVEAAFFALDGLPQAVPATLAQALPRWLEAAGE